MATDFKVLRDPFKQGAFRARVVEPPSSAELLALLRATSVPDRPIELGRAEGKVLHDFLWTTYGFFFVVSERLIQQLAAHDATGWRSYPVVVREHGDHRYFLLSIEGRCGAPDSARVTSEIVDGKGGPITVRRGLGVDPALWDGSDVFMPEDQTAWVLISERLANLWHIDSVTNVELESADEIERLSAA